MSCPSPFDTVRCAGLTAACGQGYDFTCTVDSRGVKNAELTLTNIQANVMPVLQNCATEMPAASSNYDLSFSCNMPLVSCKGGDIAWCSALGAWCFSGVRPFSCAVQGGSTSGVCTGCTGVGLQNMCNRVTPNPPFLPSTLQMSLSMWTANTCGGQWSGQTSGPGPFCQAASGATASLFATCWNGALGAFVCSDTRCTNCTNMTLFAVEGQCFNGPDSVYPPPSYYQARMMRSSSSPCKNSASEQRPLPAKLVLGIIPPVNPDEAWEATKPDAAVSV